MENKKIIEENKLIAEFMEVKNVREYELNSKHKCLIISDDDGFIDYVEGINFLSYNDNWNRIMHVVEKIESLGYDFEFKKQGKFTNVRFKGIIDYNCKRYDNITAIYNAVVEFIKWYNENKNK